MEDVKNVGHSSRRKRALIQEAISACDIKDMFNRHAVCEKLVELMIDRYPGGNLEYHSKRMGMDTTAKILVEIDSFFYRDFQGEPIDK